MTGISSRTESMTGVDSCCKEIVGIDIPECCLGTEFNLLTAAAYYEGVPVLGVAKASSVTTPRALALSHTPKKPHTLADPPPTDPADEPATAPAAPAPAAPAPAARLNFNCCPEPDNLTNL